MRLQKVAITVMCGWRDHVPGIGQEISRVAWSPSFPIDVPHWPVSCRLICLTYTGICTGNDGVRMKFWWITFGENPNTRLTGLLKNCVWRSVYLCRGEGICFVTEYQGSASSIVPQKLSTCFETGSVTGIWGLQIRLGWLANGHQRCSCLHLPGQSCKHIHHFWFFLYGCWGSNSALRVCIARTLSVEPFH